MQIPRVSVRLIATVAIVLLAACAEQPATRTVTAAQSGTSVELRVGDTLVVALDGNPTTGFDWALVGSVTPPLELAERTFTPSGTALGAPGTVSYRFKAAAPGTTRIVMTYSRSWESVPPDRTFELAVRVGSS